MIPVIGEVADLANAGIYAARGDYTNAALSAAAAIPFVGWAATGAKFAVKGAKLIKKAGKVIDSVVGAATKIADKAGQVAKAIGNLANKAGDAISDALGKVMTKAKGLVSNFSPADLAKKLKGKLDNLLTNSPKLANALNMAKGMATGFMQNLLISETMNYGLEQLSQYVDSDTITKAMILLSMLNSKYKKNKNQGITSNNKSSGDSGSSKSSGDKDKSKKDKDSGNKDKDAPKDKTKDKTKDDPNNPKPKEQEVDKSKGKTEGDSKESSRSDTQKDKNGTDVNSKQPVYEKVKYGEHFTKKGRKKALKPNVEYTSPDGYTYRTDSQGRIIECEGALVLGKGDRSEYAQRTVGKGQGRLSDDDGGHLVGAQFKGPKDIDNLVPQNSQINRSGGEWYNMESKWADALREIPPKKVTVKIEPVYSGTSMRPDSFEVTYQIEGNRPVQKTIKNQAGG
nr:DNA/RNA non-specific endonuclease [Paenibacillus silvae]